jgi:hypothetical protein
VPLALDALSAQPLHVEEQLVRRPLGHLAPRLRRRVARRVIRSNRATAGTAPSCRQRVSAAWKPGRRSSLPLATSEYSAASVQPCAAKAWTEARCASSPRPLCPCSAVETRYSPTA